MIENGEATWAIRFLQAGVIAEPGQSIVWSNLKRLAIKPVCCRLKRNMQREEHYKKMI